MFTEPNADVALLAPVPEGHLLSALSCFGKEDRVAFGSNAAMALATFKNLVGIDSTADVLIYASETPVKGVPKAKYRARWVDYVGAVSGKAPASCMAFRSPSTASDGAWDSFWIVTGLRRLDAAEFVDIKSLSGLKKRAKFASNFIPLGPTIINTPF